MASTTTKLSAGGKQHARSVSTTRLVANKTSKTQRPSAPAPKGKASSAPAPTAAAKKTLAAVPPPAAVPDVRGAAAAGSGNRSELKAQFSRLSAATSQIGAFKRSINKTFFEIGALLNQIRNERLYEVKGYGSFEAFVEREIDINKALCLKVGRIAEALHRDQALAAGLERAVAAIAALDGEVEGQASARPAGSPGGVIPLHKQ